MSEVTLDSVEPEIRISDLPPGTKFVDPFEEIYTRAPHVEDSLWVIVAIDGAGCRHIMPRRSRCVRVIEEK